MLSILPLLLLSEPRRAGETDVRQNRRLSQPALVASQAEDRLHADRPYTDHTVRSDLQSTIYNLQPAIPASWRDLLRHPAPLLKLAISPALISIGAALLIPYLNLFFKQRFTVTDAQLGLIFAGLGLATALAALAGPALSARLGKIRAIVLTQALALPFLALMGATPLLGVAVVAAFTRSALFNMGTPLYDAFAMERTDEAARPAVIGVLNGAYSIGYLFAPLLSTQIQATYGFTPLFVTTLICYALAVLAKYWFFVRDSAR